jgi:hypothetical protein
MNFRKTIFILTTAFLVCSVLLLKFQKIKNQ